MALKIHFRKKSQGVIWKSGHMYTFKYRAYNNDPNPTYLHICSFSGYHKNTGRQWRFHQGINVAYLPRKKRRQFVEDWKKHFERNKNPKITWKQLTKKYSFLKEFTRRYFYSPTYYIQKPKHIPIDKWDEEVTKSLTKDFSATIKKKLMSRLKRLFGGK